MQYRKLPKGEELKGQGVVRHIGWQEVIMKILPSGRTPVSAAGIVTADVPFMWIRWRGCRRLRIIL